MILSSQFIKKESQAQSSPGRAGNKNTPSATALLIHLALPPLMCRHMIGEGFSVLPRDPSNHR